MCDTLGRDTWLACPRISDSPTSFVLSFPLPLSLSLYCNVQNIGRCRRTSKSYESAAAGAEREGEERSCGEGSEGRRIRIWMACVHTPRQGQDMAESTQLSEMCRKKIKEKNNAKSCDKFTFLRSPSSSFRLSSLCFLLIFSCFSPSCCPYPSPTQNTLHCLPHVLPAAYR